MNKKGFITDLIKDYDAPFIYENGSVSLTYNELRNLISEQSDDPGLSLLPWEASSSKEFIINYLKIINNGGIAVLLDKSRLHHSPADYALEDITEDKIHKDTASIIFTSGSTGKPKGVCLSTSNFMASAKASVDLYNITKEDNWALSLPLFHIGAIMIIWRTIATGSSLTIISPANLTDDLSKNPQVSIISLVQLQLERLLNCDSVLDKLRRLRGIVLGGSKVDSSLIKKAIDLGIKISNSYGATETSAQFLATQLTTDLSTLTTSGKPMRGSVSEVDDKIFFVGESISLGYLGEAPFAGRFQVSDHIEADSRGNYQIHGRRDFVFQKAAENINPEILETKLSNLGLGPNFIIPIKHKSYENLIGMSFSNQLGIRKVDKIIDESLTSFEKPNFILQTTHLSNFQTGIKISRPKLSEFMSKLYVNISKDFKLRAIGNPTGDIIIVSHGFMGDSAEFEYLKDSFSETHLLVFVDIVGHGLNAKYLNIEKFEQDLCQLIKNIDKLEGKLHFITYSMSARLFNQFLRNDSISNLKCFGHFINESGAPGFTLEEEARHKRLAHDEKLLEDKSEAHIFFDKWYDQSVFEGIKEVVGFDSALLKDKIEQFYSMKDSWRVASGIVSVANQDDLRDLSKLPKGLSYHYIYGVNDKKYSQYKDIYTGRQYHSYPVDNASHNTHFMNKNRYLEILKNIINM